MTYKLQLTIALTLFIGVLVFLYLFTGVFGGTQIALTIRTNPDLTKGLVGHWTFDGNDMPLGQVNDVSGQGNHGSQIAMATGTAYVNGKIGQALNFDGVDDQIKLGDINALDGLAQITVAAWVKTTNGAEQHYVGKSICTGAAGGGVFELLSGHPTAGVPKFHAYTASGGDNAADTVAITDNVWHHLVGVYDGSFVRIYVDGVEKSSTVLTGALSSTVHQVEIGGGCNADSTFTQSLIDDVRVYNRALSASEIKRLYELGATTYVNTTITTNPDLKNGLVGHWTFDGEDLKDNAVDRSGQGNHGYLTNFTSTTTQPGKIGQALNFDGSTNYVDAGSGSSLSTPGAVTVCVWFKGNLFSGSDRAIVANGDVSAVNTQYDLEVLSGGAFRFSWSNALAEFEQNDTVDNAVQVGTWYHGCGVRDAAGIGYAFLDGTDQTATRNNNITPPASPSGNTQISHFSGQFFDGQIDDVRIYNRALSASEIKRLYELGATTHVAETITTNPDLTNGLVGHWTFDGKDTDWSSTTAEISDHSGANHGNTHDISATNTVPGVIGQAINFISNSDDIEIANEPSFDFERTDPFSISAWVYRHTNATEDDIFEKWDANNSRGYGVFFESSANQVIGVMNNGGNQNRVGSATNISLNQWHHVVMTHDGSSTADGIKLYINNIEQSSTITDTMSSGSILNNIAPTIGNESSSASCCGFDGLIDDVRVYSRMLSAAEVKRLYDLGR